MSNREQRRMKRHDWEEGLPIRPVNHLNPLAGLKRRRRDLRIFQGARELDLNGPTYDEKTDKITFLHPTKGERKMARRRIDAQGRMGQLLAGTPLSRGQPDWKR